MELKLIRLEELHIVKIDNPKNRLEGQYKMQKVMK
jgi:hypothetical protein